MKKSTAIATLVAGGVPALVIAFIASLGLWLGGPESGFTLQGLPEPTAHNYQYVETHPELFAEIPCYCGCYSLGHENLRDCFLRRKGGYERHASRCAICGREADDVEEMMATGSPGADYIRSQIELSYAHYGRPTAPLEAGGHQ
jgi:hypothetical protein